MVEVLDRILPAEDEEISALARKAFEKQGFKILTSAKVAKLDKGKNNVTDHIDVGGKTEKITVDRVISAVGITGNVENIGLEKTKVKVDRGHIVVNPFCATDEPGVYAIGDLVGPPWLAHKASHEGIIVVEKIAGLKDVHPLNPRNVPGCTYCTPQVASVGLTEKKAIEAGHTVKVGRFPFMANGRARALGDTTGFVKFLADAKTDEILGVHIVGPFASELISEAVVAMEFKASAEDIARICHAHPSLSEATKEAALAVDKRTLNF